MELSNIWLILSGLYALGLGLMIWNWLRIGHTPAGKRPLPSVSILVPARNEAENISPLLDDLARQHYTQGFEIIVIDDHSTDGTVKEVERTPGNVRLISLEQGQGKKAAISKGVANATGEVIVTIDADCRVGENWLVSMMKPFADEAITMTFGPVTYGGDAFSDRLQALELWSLVGVGAATWQMGMPTMCNGANLAYRKSAFEAVGGFKGSQDISSGDDEFMLQSVKAKFGAAAIKFVKDPFAVVSTQASHTLKDFVHQRRRWAGKWNLHKAIGPKLLALTVFGFHLSVLLAVVGWAVGSIPTGGFFAGLGLKVFSEFLFLRTVSGSMRMPFPYFGFVCWQLWYSVYAVGIGLAVQRGGFVWKDRELQR